MCLTTFCFDNQDLANSCTEEEDQMRQMILALFMMIAVGVFAVAEGRDRNAQTHQQKEARQQNEGCQLIPNEDLNKQKTERDGSTMKGLVF